MAGLAAGATAVAAGRSALVLAGRAPGGRARTTERDGFRFNEGPHALYLAGAGAGVLDSLDVRPVGSKPPLPRYQLVLGDRPHLLPAGAASLLRSSALGARGKLQVGRLLAGLPRLDAAAQAGTSAAAWLDGHDLRADARAVLEAVVRISTYCADLDVLGADVAVGQLQAATAGGVLYLDGGWGRLLTDLATRVEVHRGSPVSCIGGGDGSFTVGTADGDHRARSVVIAAGGPRAARALLPADPGWALGPEVTAACLDIGARAEPAAPWVLSADEPLYAATQPAAHAPAGHTAVTVVRYGARSAEVDRPDLEAFLRRTGLGADDIVTSRFLARMAVVSALPALAGTAERPAVGATGVPGVFVAGDWVGPVGFLADASLASGQAAGLAAVRHTGRSATIAA